MPKASGMTLLTICFICNACLTHSHAGSKQFLLDYFRDKSFMLTMNVCWKYRAIADFMQMAKSQHFNKLIEIHQDEHDVALFMSYLSTNNYFILDARQRCISSWKILNYVNETLGFRFPLKFLLLSDDRALDGKSIDALESYSILPSADVTIASKLHATDSFELVQVYRIDMSHAITWESVGVWNISNGFVSNNNKREMQTRRRNFRGAVMPVVFYIEFNETWHHLEDFKRPRIDTFTKQNYGAIKALMEYCNISFEMVPVTIWGYYNETSKSWNGLIEKVAKAEVVLAGSSPYFTAQRLSVVDFIKMQNQLEIKFILKKPPLSYMFNMYALPFQANVWKALLAAMLAFFATMYFIVNWEARKIGKINDKTKFSPSDVALILWEAVCQQGTTTDSRTIAGRLLDFTMYSTFFFLYSSYSAYIVVILQSTHPISDYQELYDSPMSAGGMETSYMRVYLGGSMNPLQQRIYNTKIGPDGYYVLEEGMDRVQQGFFAFHSEVAASYDYIARKFSPYDICNLQFMDGFNSHLKGYTSVPKNSPYKEIFKVGLMIIDESGIQVRNYLRYAQPPKCDGNAASFITVGLRDMYHAFIILAAGMATAILILIAETAIHYRKA